MSIRTLMGESLIVQGVRGDAVAECPAVAGPGVIFELRVPSPECRCRGAGEVLAS